jgi:DNA-binding response OmpR family regulator
MSGRCDMTISLEKMQARINLERATALVLDGNQESRGLLGQILNGFGVRRLHRCATAREAEQAVASDEIDLAFVDASLQDQSGFDWVQWFRREAPEPNRFVPVLMLAGHTAMSRVEKARDCGANFIVAKPISPPVLLDRILWVARSERMFIYTDNYSGPDRRFKAEGPPPGVAERRSPDRAADGKGTSPAAAGQADAAPRRQRAGG